MGSDANPLVFQIHQALPRILPEFLTRQRWFGGKARTIRSAQVLEVIPMTAGQREAFVVLARIEYADGHDQTYALPLIPAPSDRITLQPGEQAIPSLRFQMGSGPGETTLYDALWDTEYPIVLIEAMYGSRSFAGSHGEIFASPTQAFRKTWKREQSTPAPSLMRAEQSNTSIKFGDQFILKFYRRLEGGINPDLEVGAFLTDKASFPHTPALNGALEYRRPQAPAITLGILQSFVPNRGDAWRYTLEALDGYFERIIGTIPRPTLPSHSILEFNGIEIPPEPANLIGDYWESAGLLGRRTAELHLALASDSEDPAFCPEPFSSAFRRSQFESMSDLASQVFRTLEMRLASLPDSVRKDGGTVLIREPELLACFDSFAQREMTGKRIRIHGDYHLGQVLYTGSDFVIIDFEGEPARSIEERRAKRSPLQDVAGMLRSFHYAAYTALFRQLAEKAGHSDSKNLETWARYWQTWVSVRFLKDYFEVSADAPFIPRTTDEISILLNAYLLEKAVYELGYELNNRPDWVRLPLQGILDLLEASS